MSDTDVQVTFGANTGGAEAGIDSVAHKLKDLDIPVRELAESFGLLRKTLVEAFAAREIAEFVEHISELGEQAVRTSTMLGIGIEEVQKLGFAAKMVGGSSDEMATGLERLERNMAEAQSGSGKAYEAFHNLGISLDDLKTKSPVEIMGMIADKFASTEDGATKTAYAMDLMGRSGAQLIPIFDQGAAGLEKMGAIAQQTGSILSGPQAEALEKTHQGLTTLGASVEGVGISLLEVLHPAIDAAIQGLTQLVQSINFVVQGFRLLALMIEDGIILSVAKLVEKFEEIGTVGKEYIEEAEIAFQTLGQVIDDVVHLHFDQAVKDWEAGSARIVQAEKNAAAEIADIGRQYEEFKTKVLDATASLFTFAAGQEAAAKKAQLPPAPTTGGEAKEDNTDLQIAKNDAATELELQRIGLAMKKDLLDQEVSANLISKQQELKALEDLVNQKQVIELQALEQEKALYDEGSAEYAAIQNKEKVIAAQTQADIQKLVAQSAAEQKKQYTQVFTVINSAFDEMVTGILRGTQTWQAALGKLFDNLAIKFIDDVVLKMVESWAEMELQKLGITKAANAALVALGIESSTEGAAAQTAVQAGANAAKITADGAVTFAGVFANLSPVLGPAAAGPAAAAEGVVLAQIPQASLAVGAWDLDSDTVAQLHAGEMVVPQTFAQGLRDGSGLGGGDNYSVSISVNAIDAQSGATFLKQNAGVIAQTLVGQMRNGNSALRGAMS